MSRDTFERLGELLKNVEFCFCTLCSHQAEYGHCYACKCGNRQPEPPELDIKEIKKLKAALDHWRDHAIRFARRAR